MPRVDLLRQTHGGILRRPRLRLLWSRRLPCISSRSIPVAPALRSYADDGPSRKAVDDGQARPTESPPANSEPGAMSRLLEEMTEESLLSSPRRSGKMVGEAGFSSDLKQRLEARIASGQMDPDHQQAASIASIPDHAGKGTRELAGSEPWAGSEKLADAALRMLEDAHKPLRGTIRRAVKPAPVDMRLKHQSKPNSAQRLVNARDKSSIYSLSQDVGMSEKEKEDMRRIFKERFQPSARAVPATIQGLQSLASERIEDAIARGLFKNIPRGKGVNVERDYQANSPFIDTTEYFMNKIIQKQEVLPPWVEKQQEVTRTIATFRARLRHDWKRHAARVIASKGGSLEVQVRRAERYAEAEARWNPRAPKTETLASIDAMGNLTRVKVMEAPPEAGGTSAGGVAPLVTKLEPTVTVTSERVGRAEATESSDPVSTTTASASTEAQAAASVHIASLPSSSTSTTNSLSPSPSPSPPSTTSNDDPPSRLFRDSAWEKTELAYHTLALAQLNSLTRSYNLMAPEAARKPYFSLDRELRACYADTAPLVAAEIRARARAPPLRHADGAAPHRPGGVLDKFSRGEQVRVWESRRPKYGFREFWRDLFQRKEA